MINTESVLHGFTDLKNLDHLGPIVLNQAKGIYVYDQNGKNTLTLIQVYGIQLWASTIRG